MIAHTSTRKTRKKATIYLLDVHVEQQLLEVSSLVDASVGAAAHHRGLLQGHGVQGQQQQTVGNLHRRSLGGKSIKEIKYGVCVSDGQAYHIRTRVNTKKRSTCWGMPYWPGTPPAPPLTTRLERMMSTVVWFTRWRAFSIPVA